MQEFNKAYDTFMENMNGHSKETLVQKLTAIENLQQMIQSIKKTPNLPKEDQELLDCSSTNLGALQSGLTSGQCVLGYTAHVMECNANKTRFVYMGKI